MNKRAVTAILGLLLVIFAGFMAVALLIGFGDGFGSRDTLGLGIGVFACLAAGGPLFWIFRKHVTDRSLGTREGLAVTALGWTVLAGAGALPFCIAYPDKISYTDAYFEIMSGLTTTGSTILTPEMIDEQLGSGLLFWRSFTHWIGGMGIILLTVAILPLLGAGGYQLFRAEVPGPTKDRLRPRIIETAKTLWLIYVGLSALETLLLWLCGLSLYQSLCHTFGTMATGGFSTYSRSVGHFETVLGPTRGAIAEFIIVGFMFLAGCNFVLLYRVMLRKSLKPLWRSTEFKVYLTMIGSAIALMTLMLVTSAPTELAQQVHGEEAKGYGFWSGLRASLFNTVAIQTTTGFGTEDFHVWPSGIRVILLLLMICGGCAGSTAGGMKLMRVILLLKFAWSELLKIIRPRAVFLVKHENTAVEGEVLRSVLGYFVLYVISLAIGTLLMTLILQGPPHMPGEEGPQGTLTTAFTSCLATLSNIGPGLAGVGPDRNFSGIPDGGKWLLSLLMLMGRLEIFTVVALLAPNTWRK